MSPRAYQLAKPVPLPSEARVVDLQEARRSKRLSAYRERLDAVLESNRVAVGRLFLTGTLFTREGTRAGRELLQAHEHLLRVVTLLERLSDRGDVPAPRRPESVEAVFHELDTLLSRTATLTTQTTELLASIKRD